MASRIESDSFGKIKVPADKYWGAQTERSLKYFKIGKILVPLEIIRAIAIIKKAAAIVNFKSKSLDKKISQAIIKASDEVIKGKFNNHFPYHYLRFSGFKLVLANQVLINYFLLPF